MKKITLCTLLSAILVLTGCGSQEVSGTVSGGFSEYLGKAYESIVAQSQEKNLELKNSQADEEAPPQEAESLALTPAVQEEAEVTEEVPEAEKPGEEVTVAEVEHQTIEEQQTSEEEADETDQNGETETPEAQASEENGYLIYIDPGHQGQGNYDYEPIGPGASETKPKVSSGTQGCSTGIEENAFNLDVSFRLRDELQARGYQVVLIRESADVDISNAERAQMANEAGADAFIRIHANGNDDSSVTGSETICMTPSNPYNAWLYEQSRSLSDNVLSSMCSSTGLAPRYVWETDTMSGLNWCEVPDTIMEMVYMTNPSEDQYMATDEFRDSCASGIADGIDAYFGR